MNKYLCYKSQLNNKWGYHSRLENVWRVKISVREQFSQLCRFFLVNWMCVCVWLSRVRIWTMATNGRNWMECSLLLATHGTWYNGRMAQILNCLHQDIWCLKLLFQLSNVPQLKRHIIESLFPYFVAISFFFHSSWILFTRPSSIHSPKFVQISKEQSEQLHYKFISITSFSFRLLRSLRTFLKW